MKLFAIISWLLLLFLSPSACTFDPSHARPPLGPLGVTLDFVFATNWPTATKVSGSRNWSWSIHLVFTQPVHDIFTDRELWIIGWHAYQEMRADVVQYGINPKHPKYNPRAMTLLAFGNEIILASSQKASNLNRCAMAWRDEGNPEQPEHRRGAKCGEEMVCHLYALNNRDQELRTRNPSISTWAAAGSIDNPAPTPPCGNPEEWGCNRFISQHGLRPLPESEAPQGPEVSEGPWEGKEFTVNQYQLFGGVRETSLEEAKFASTLRGRSYL